MTRRHIVYLHGFASSARSSKAAYLAGRAAESGFDFTAPDLNDPDFSTLTVTRMIERVRALLREAPEAPATLVGSSLGGLVALLAAASSSEAPGARVHAMVLMAPALDLAPGLEAHFGPERMHEWETTGHLDVFHYADEAVRPLHWGFMADARRYDPWRVTPEVPTLVFQGRRDETVSPVMVGRWAAGRPNVRLQFLDDGHQLLDSLPAMWEAISRFPAVVA